MKSSYVEKNNIVSPLCISQPLDVRPSYSHHFIALIFILSHKKSLDFSLTFYYIPIRILIVIVIINVYWYNHET